MGGYADAFHASTFTFQDYSSCSSVFTDEALESENKSSTSGERN